MKRPFLCDRLTPVRNTPVTFLVEAETMVEAKQITEELIYAAAFAEGSYPDPTHRLAPPQWALIEAQSALKFGKLVTGTETSRRQQRRRSRR